MIEYNFFLDKPNSSEETYVMFNAMCEKRCKFSIGEKVLPSDWNKKAMRSNERNANVNIVLGKIDLHMAQLKLDIATNNTTVLSSKLKTDVLIVAGKKEVVKKEVFSFFEMWKKIVAERENGQEKHDGLMFATNTILSYKATMKVIEAYVKATGNIMEMHKFDIKNDLDNFSNYLIGLPNFNKNSISLHLKNLKTFIGAAYAREWHTNLIFRDPKFKVVAERSENIDVSMDVLDAMDKMILEGNEAIARDWFLVEAMTGLRVSDSTSLTLENIVENNITKVSKKTNKKVTVPISNILKNILTRNNGGWPTAISVVLINSNIKSVAKKTGLLNKKVLFTETRQGKPKHTYYFEWEVVTTHTGRRSFVSNMRRSNIDSADRAKLTGLTETTMAFYDKVTHEEVAKKVSTNSFFK